MNIEDLSLRDICTSGEETSIGSDDYVLFLLQGTALKKIEYDELAAAIIEQYNKSLLAGSAQSVQSAINNSVMPGISANAGNITTLQSNYSDLAARVTTNEGNIANILNWSADWGMLEMSDSNGRLIKSTSNMIIPGTVDTYIGKGSSSIYFQATTNGIKFMKAGHYLQIMESCWDKTTPQHSSNVTVCKRSDQTNTGQFHVGATAYDWGGTDHNSIRISYLPPSFVNEEMVLCAAHSDATNGNKIIGARASFIPLFVAS